MSLMSTEPQVSSDADPKVGTNTPPDATVALPTTSWRDTLPDDLKGDASLANFQSPEALAKSYVHLRKASSSEKINVPNQYATEEDWKEIYGKLGLPAKPEEYKVDTKGLSIPEEALKEFIPVAHKAGILPKQARALMEWDQARTLAAQEAQQKAQETVKAEAVKSLKGEWGQAFERNIQRGERVLQENGSPELIEALTKSGMNFNPAVVKFLAKLGEQYDESTLPGKTAGTMVRSPDEARREWETIQGAGMSHPYFDAKHPAHDRAVQDVARLFEQMG